MKHLKLPEWDATKCKVEVDRSNLTEDGSTYLAWPDFFYQGAMKNYNNSKIRPAEYWTTHIPYLANCGKYSSIINFN